MFTTLNLEEFSKLSEREIESKYKMIGEGQTRKVFDLRNGFVLKLTSDYKKYENQKEFEVWSQSQDSLKKYLTPCMLDPIDANRLYMPKAELLNIKYSYFNGYLQTNLKPSEINDLLNAVYLLSADFNLVYNDLLLPQNWGIVNGELKLIDYSLNFDVDYDDE